jgi:large subunit ribosomal protein L9
MKIILKQDYENLGNTGEVIKVKDGYARNFLIPQGIAVLATRRNMQLLEQELKNRQRLKNMEKKVAEELAEQLGKVSITAAVPVGEEDKIFGSVTSQMIADLLKEKDFDVDKKKIILDEPIKSLGIYTVSVKLHSDVTANVRVWVVKE